MADISNESDRALLEPNVIEAMNALGVTEFHEVTEPEETVRLTIDRIPFNTKPSGAEVAAITSRLKDPSSVMDLSYERFCRAMALGVTWCGAVFDGGWDRDHFVSQRLFALDIDNKVDEFDDEGFPKRNPDGSVKQRALDESEALYLDPIRAIKRAYFYDLDPICVYFSMSSTPEHLRFRIVFDSVTPATSVEQADAIIANLMELYPECDPACKNLNRLWFGSNGEVLEPWRVRTVRYA